MRSTKTSQIIAGSEKSTPPPSVPRPWGIAWPVTGLSTETLFPIAEVSTMGVTRFQWTARSTAALGCDGRGDGEAATSLA